MVEKKLNFNQPILSVRRRSRIDERKIDNPFPVIPRLRPYGSEPNSGPVRNPGAVPFQWEQIPGQPKEQIKRELKNRDRPPIAAKLSASSENKIEALPRTSPSDGANIKYRERSNQTAEESKDSAPGNYDEAFVDGPGSLSRTESFLSSCSMSGLTGVDDLDGEFSRRFSRDPLAREIMMDAKGPQNVPEEQSSVREQPQELKKETTNREKPAVWFQPRFAKSCYKDKEEKEESDHDRDQHENLIAVCCLLPWSCLNSSVCILNPVRGMSVGTRLTTLPARRVESGSSSAGSSTDAENETAELKENETSSEEEVAQLESRNALTHGDSPLSSVEEREAGGVPEDTKHLCIEGFGSHKKSFKTLRELLWADEGSPKDSDSRSCVEKTVYVDKVDKTRSCSPNTKAPEVPGSGEGNNGITTKGTDRTHTMDSSLEDFKMLSTTGREAKLLPNAHTCGDFNIVSSVDKSDRKWGMTLPKRLGRDEENMEAAEREDARSAEKQLPRATTLGNSHEKRPKFPVPPPLPRSPSDSWLCRALPSMSTKKASTPTFISRCSNKS